MVRASVPDGCEAMQRLFDAMLSTRLGNHGLHDDAFSVGPFPFAVNHIADTNHTIVTQNHCA